MEVRVLDGNNHPIAGDVRNRFAFDARIHDARKGFDLLLKKGGKIPLSPFGQRTRNCSN